MCHYHRLHRLLLKMQLPATEKWLNSALRKSTAIGHHGHTQESMMISLSQILEAALRAPSKKPMARNNVRNTQLVKASPMSRIKTQLQVAWLRHQKMRLCRRVAWMS